MSKQYPHFVSFDIYDLYGTLLHADATDIVHAAVYDAHMIAAATAHKAKQQHPAAAYIAVTITPFSSSRPGDMLSAFLTYKALIVCKEGGA